MAYRRIKFRNCRIQNSDARLVFEERKFFHITPVLRAPPPHFYTFEAPSPPLPHFHLFPPPTPHISTVFHPTPPPPHFIVPPLPPPHTHTHCTHTLSAHFYCFPSTTSTTIVFTAPPPPRDILFWTSREQLLREKRIKHWPQEPTPTPLETASFAPHPLRILLPSVGGMNIFWNYTFPKKRNLKLRKDAIHYSSYLK